MRNLRVGELSGRGGAGSDRQSRSRSAADHVTIGSEEVENGGAKTDRPVGKAPALTAFGPLLICSDEDEAQRDEPWRIRLCESEARTGARCGNGRRSLRFP